ncbi:MAG: hypothetical protein H6815_02685 [Phycisphaeraceae bacterium]|nr:hypothetical protein [Phycisphaerales bacterium]MCB9859333.1 hypothetical protein [Phycisphaeraceae bacterium]
MPRGLLPIIFILLFTVLPPVLRAISESKKTAKKRKAMSQIDRLRELGRDDEADAIAGMAGLPVPTRTASAPSLADEDSPVWDPNAGLNKPFASVDATGQPRPGSLREARMQQIQERKAQRDAEMQRLRDLARSRAASSTGPAASTSTPVSSPAQTTSPFVHTQSQSPSSPQNVHPAIARIRAALDAKVQQEQQLRKQASRPEPKPEEEQISLVERERRREKAERQRLARERAQRQAAAKQHEHIHHEGEDLREHHLASFQTSLGPDGYSDESQSNFSNPARQRLGLGSDVRSLRRAFLLSEVLKKPVALREDENDLVF